MKNAAVLLASSLLVSTGCTSRVDDGGSLAASLEELEPPPGWRWIGFVGDVNADGYDDAAAWRSPTEVGVVFGRADAEPPTNPEVSIHIDAHEDDSTRGVTMIPLGDINGDGFADLAIPRVEKTHVVLGGAEPASLDSSAPDERLVSFGTAWVRRAGDLDADGLDDLIVRFYGSSAIIRGRPQWAAVGEDSIPDDAIVLEDPALAGYGVSTIGDIDGDGHGDIASTPYGGAARLHSGAALPWASVVDVEDLPADLGVVQAPADQSPFPSLPGSVVPSVTLHPLGDVNTDGLDDFALGHWWSVDRPVSFVVFGADGSPSRQRDDLSAGVGGVRIDGQAQTLVSPGDLDGDGRRDLMFGGVGYDTGYWVVQPEVMPALSTRVLLGLPASATTPGAGLPLPRPSEARQYGRGVSAGDFDGDGRTDLIVGYLVPTSDEDWQERGQFLLNRLSTR